MRFDSFVMAAVPSECWLQISRFFASKRKHEQVVQATPNTLTCAECTAENNGPWRYYSASAWCLAGSVVEIPLAVALNARGVTYNQAVRLPGEFHRELNVEHWTLRVGIVVAGGRRVQDAAAR